jgi:uncharacterized protein (TIGR01777 family)
MKIIITGATGLIGTALSKELIDRGDELYIFTRNPEKGLNEIPGAKDYIKWNYNKPEDWEMHLNNKDAVIHLAGANLSHKRWNEDYKKIIWNSRIKSGENLVKAINKAPVKPKIFITASAIGYYGDRGNELLTEDNPPGKDFLARLCIEWEKSTSHVESSGIRWVGMRTGVVLSPKEGMLKKILTPFKLFVGGSIGSGDQWLSWIHYKDIIRGYLFALDNDTIRGPVNASSPNPLTMRHFVETLGKVLKRPSLFKVPKILLKTVFGEVADSITASLKVIPQKLMETNFDFKFKDPESALRDLLKK